LIAFYGLSGIPFRITLIKILNENNGDLENAISDAKEKYKSGELQKTVKKIKDERMLKKGENI
jgi:hypothetical protein